MYRWIVLVVLSVHSDRSCYSWCSGAFEHRFPCCPETTQKISTCVFFLLGFVSRRRWRHLQEDLWLSILIFFFFYFCEVATARASGNEQRAGTNSERRRYLCGFHTSGRGLGAVRWPATRCCADSDAPEASWSRLEPSSTSAATSASESSQPRPTSSSTSASPFSDIGECFKGSDSLGEFHSLRRHHGWSSATRRGALRQAVGSAPCWQVDQAVQHDNELCQDAALVVDHPGDQPLPPWSKEEAFGSPFWRRSCTATFLLTLDSPLRLSTLQSPPPPIIQPRHSLFLLSCQHLTAWVDTCGSESMSAWRRYEVPSSSTPFSTNVNVQVRAVFSISFTGILTSPII